MPKRANRINDCKSETWNFTSLTFSGVFRAYILLLNLPFKALPLINDNLRFRFTRTRITNFG